MPSGADLEYARMLAQAGVSPANAQGYDGARLEQMSDVAGVDNLVASEINDISSAINRALSLHYAGTRGLDPAALVDVEVTTRVGNIASIDVLSDGLIYGHNAVNNRLYSSSDSGDTWNQVNANLPALISGAEGTGLRDLADGEVLLMLRAGGLYRSSGWSVNKTTATWTQVLACTAGAWILPGQVDVYGDRVIACEYAIPRTASRKLSVSYDGGLTFTTAIDLNIDYPANIADTHWHAVGIDPYVGSGRFWASHGDGPNRLLYSDDGVTWTEYLTAQQPMSITATEYGIILGSDVEPNGLEFINRNTMIKTQIITWRGGPSVIGFANKAITAPDGTVYVAFQSTINSLPAPIIAASPDGKRGAIVYELAPAGATQPNLRNIMLDANGKIIVPALLDGVAVDVVATRIGNGSVTYEDLNKSGALEGNADATSVGIGWRTNASIYGVALGKDADARSTIGAAIAIGHAASSLFGQGIALGAAATVGAVGGVAIGASCEVLTGVAIGLNSDALDGVAVGNGAKSTIGSGTAVGNSARTFATTHVAIGALAITATGLLNMTAVGYGANALATHATAVGTGAIVGAAAAQGSAFGRNAQATGNASMAIGASSASAHDNGIALGVGQTTTAFAQLRLGPKHTEITEIADPTAPAADAARWYVKDNGAGKTQLCVRFATGAVQVIATEP